MLKQKLFVKIVSTFLAICMLSATCYAEATNAGSSAAGETQQVFSDNVVTKKIKTTSNGKVVNSFDASAGTLVIENELGVCEMFFVAYTKRGVKDPSERPVTFAFNGGPGSSSSFLCMGSFGPLRVDVSAPGSDKPVSSEIKANPNSIFDMTDIVFIDPVGTGYSRALGDTDETVYYDYYNDAFVTSDFISAYLTRYNRLSSPVFIAGESYGAARAVLTATYLVADRHIPVVGLMLISCASDYSALLESRNSDTTFANEIPSYAAVAWYHKRLDKKYLDMKLEDYLDEVKTFVKEEYTSALFKGSRISDKEKTGIAKKISQYTGVSEELILKYDLRLWSDIFREELLADKGLYVGYYDGRYTGIIDGDQIEDPLDSMIDPIYTSALLDLVTNKIGFKTDTEYISVSDDVNFAWTFANNSYLSQEGLLYLLLNYSPDMKIWVICGYYDLTTMFCSSEWTFSHIFLDNDELEKNISFTYYKSGHMFYTDKKALKQFCEFAAKWFKS